MLQMSMSKMSLKVLLVVFALVFNAGVGLSDENKDDPNERNTAVCGNFFW